MFPPEGFDSPRPLLSSALLSAKGGTMFLSVLLVPPVPSAFDLRRNKLLVPAGVAVNGVNLSCVWIFRLCWTGGARLTLGLVERTSEATPSMLGMDVDLRPCSRFLSGIEREACPGASPTSGG